MLVDVAKSSQLASADRVRVRKQQQKFAEYEIMIHRRVAAAEARAHRAETAATRERQRVREVERRNQIQIERLQQESHEEERALQLECDAAQRDLQESEQHIEYLEEMVTSSEHRVHGAEARVQELQREVEIVHSQKRTLDETLQAQQTTFDEALQQSRARESQLEQRIQEAERRAEEAERRARDARQRASEVEPSWVVQRDEINLTDTELGRGGWAVVRVAVFRGVRCAAKCLYRQIISNYNRRLFTREMNMAAQVRHPNLLQFIGATFQGEMIILTELMPTSVRGELEDERPFSQNQITSISLDVARALNYLHLMQPSPIIHRDISSANVLLEPGPSNSWRAKVSDYGSVNLLERLTTAAPGNPTYAAPEAGNPALQSPKMDIFSFGVLLVEMCSAEFPEVADREDLICSIQQPRRVALIRRCLAEDRNARPSANDIITELSERNP